MSALLLRPERILNVDACLLRPIFGNGERDPKMDENGWFPVGFSVKVYSSPTGGR